MKNFEMILERMNLSIQKEYARNRYNANILMIETALAKEIRTVYFIKVLRDIANATKNATQLIIKIPKSMSTIIRISDIKWIRLVNTIREVIKKFQPQMRLEFFI